MYGVSSDRRKPQRRRIGAPGESAVIALIGFVAASPAIAASIDINSEWRIYPQTRSPERLTSLSSPPPQAARPSSGLSSSVFTPSTFPNATGPQRVSGPAPFAAVDHLGTASKQKEEEGMRRIGEDELLAIFSGSRVVPTPDRGSNAPPFGEFFHKDHRWTGTLQSYSLQTFRGRWTVKGNLLCVMPSKGREECRGVWMDMNNNEIMIKPLDLWSEIGSAPIPVGISRAE